MMILGVAGSPVLHSLRPVIFRELFRASGLRTGGIDPEAAYFRVAARTAAEAVSLFRALEMRGMNLTSPFKEEVVPLVDELRPEARRLGAVNCLKRLDESRIAGANTDPQGVLSGLARLGADPAGKECLVIGAGGAGKAAAQALQSARARVVVANRTLERAQELARRLGCAAASLEDLPRLAKTSSVIVSTLASDLVPDPAVWLPEARARENLVVVDADYKKGSLGRLAHDRGFRVVEGTEWLLGQALPAFELFTDRQAPAISIDDIRKSLTASRGETLRRTIALIGIMGSGKTTVGQFLAKATGLPFVDSDREIEREAGSSINEIFAREGESGFRERESRMLDRITSSQTGCVLSTGGGAPTIPRNAEMLRSRCLCVWLYISPERAASRAQASTRPLLAGRDPVTTLKSLERERRGAYASCAHLVVSNEVRESREAAEVIYEEISRNA